MTSAHEPGVPGHRGEVAGGSDTGPRPAASVRGVASPNDGQATASRRVVLAVAAIALSALAAGPFAPSARAQGTFPTKPITLIVPFAPGASSDGIARVVAKEMSANLGQPIVVENKPGAGGAGGLITMARAAPDGHTIGLGATGALAINLHLPDAAPLDPKRDLAPIGKLADIPLVLVTAPSSGHADLKSMVAAAKAGGLSCGNAGQYTAHHMAAELLWSMVGAPVTAVPYRGSALAVTDAVGGTVPMAVVDLTAAGPHLKTGRLVALGVTSAARTRVAPEIPTIAEAGVPGYAAAGWMGLLAPAATPAPVRARLTQALQAAMAKPEVQQQILALAAEPDFQDGPTFERFIRDESAKWAGVIAKLPPAKN